MNAGNYNEVVEFYSPDIFQDEYGQQTTNYDLAFVTRAEVRHMKGDTLVSNDEIVHDYTKTFYVRIYHQFDEQWRIFYDGRYWRILSIDRQKDNQRIAVVAQVIND